MHALLASIFAAVFSFCHATSIHQASQTRVMYAEEQTVLAGRYIPTRREARHMESQQSYAEDACSSCQVKNDSYVAH